MDKLKVCLVGCGRISFKHAEAYANNFDSLEVVGFCDLIEERALRTRQKYYDLLKAKGIEVKREIPIYTDYIKMLKEQNTDIVDIATFSGSHAEQVLVALDFDRHVIVEKPMALSIEDADRMIQKAREKRKVLAVCLQNRFNKSVQKLKATIESGKFGKILYGVANIRWNRNDDYYRQDAWRGTWEQDGGALMNQCSHNIDLLQWVINSDVDEIYGDIETFLRPIEAEDTGFALLRFRNGARGIIEGTTCVWPSNLEETLSIFGETGTAVLGGKSVNKIVVWRVPEEDEKEVIEKFVENPDDVYGFGHIPLFRNVIEAIKNDGDPLVTGEEGRKSLEIILGIYKSSVEEKPVKLPLKNFSTLDMKIKYKRQMDEK
ncbi:Gfo/Idh/MocA family protein [Caldicellulosiruptor morganii]|uniref:Gfo/Idh/MocA family oxidoreductase n=1 Tax=Caldicellulosiruptor morganii TaxID=1387555 RepID=A0ABY7BLK6_9FIRM|nr:Gfo/Idh/MocA family oxidoreductase [Caldicellulosiruptor morganii]WAM32936.1 Gfo/Idh/MocA family oxidoreductase [Caldicellulosiruptor morganii]